jgi:hypothetical protein
MILNEVQPGQMFRFMGNSATEWPGVYMRSKAVGEGDVFLEAEEEGGKFKIPANPARFARRILPNPNTEIILVSQTP